MALIVYSHVCCPFASAQPPGRHDVESRRVRAPPSSSSSCVPRYVPTYLPGYLPPIVLLTSHPCICPKYGLSLGPSARSDPPSQPARKSGFHQLAGRGGPSSCPFKDTSTLPICVSASVSAPVSRGVSRGCPSCDGLSARMYSVHSNTITYHQEGALWQPRRLRASEGPSSLHRHVYRSSRIA